MLGLYDMTAIITIWGHSSVGRAPAWHAGGQGFKSPWLHYILVVIVIDSGDSHKSNDWTDIG